MPSVAALALAGVLALGPGTLAADVQVPEGGCVTSDTSLRWGFKESFRSYISGAIALGSWSTSGDVGYQVPTFSFTGGTGFVMPDRSSGEAAFEGELVFTGHGGILRTVLANPRIVLGEPRSATLFVDVTGDTMDLVSVAAENVAFVTIEWSGSDEAIDVEAGTWDVSQARVTLSAAGADAFGTYRAGEIFDPMDISFTVAPECLTPSTTLWWVVGAAALVGAVGAGVAIARARKLPEQGRQ